MAEPHPGEWGRRLRPASPRPPQEHCIAGPRRRSSPANAAAGTSSMRSSPARSGGLGRFPSIPGTPWPRRRSSTRPDGALRKERASRCRATSRYGQRPAMMRLWTFRPTVMCTANGPGIPAGPARWPAGPCNGPASRALKIGLPAGDLYRAPGLRRVGDGSSKTRIEHHRPLITPEGILDVPTLDVAPATWTPSICVGASSRACRS